jgi:5'-3' exonuclease
VYLTTKFIKSTTAFTKDVIIVTNDNDYLQLRQDGVFIYNLLGKNGTSLGTRSKGTPDVDLLIKVLMGDTSDNICSVHPKVGIKTAQKVANMTPEARLAWLKEKGAECVRRFDMNMKLVSFTYIPEDLVEMFYDTNEFRICE